MKSAATQDRWFETKSDLARVLQGRQLLTTCQVFKGLRSIIFFTITLPTHEIQWFSKMNRCDRHTVRCLLD